MWRDFDGCCYLGRCFVDNAEKLLSCFLKSLNAINGHGEYFVHCSDFLVQPFLIPLPVDGPVVVSYAACGWCVCEVDG